MNIGHESASEANQPKLVTWSPLGHQNDLVTFCISLTLQVKKKKNISHDAFGTKFGRVHMQKQDLSKLQTRKMKGLRKRKAADVDTNSNEQEDHAPKSSKVDSWVWPWGDGYPLCVITAALMFFYFYFPLSQSLVSPMQLLISWVFQ